MSVRVLTAVIALVVGAAARGEARRENAGAGVPAAVSREVSVRAVERGIPAAEMLAPVTEAAKQGVPPDLVAAKVLEGISKGVPPGRIVAVARDLTDRLARADGVLKDAQRSGIAPPSDRKAAIADLGAALATGVQPPQIASLVEAAKAARGGSADAVVSATHVVGELTRRALPPADAMAIGLAIARRGPRPPGEIAALLETWRAEGGKDTRAFADEAVRRIESGRKLDGMVDPFAESPDRIKHDREPERDRDREGLAGSDVGKRGADQGVGPAERSDTGREAVPGLGDAAHGQGNGGGKGRNK